MRSKKCFMGSTVGMKTVLHCAMCILHTLNPLLESDKYSRDCTVSADRDDDDVADDEDAGKHKQKPADGMSPHTKGDEDHIEAEQAFDKDDDAELISEDFYYTYEEHVSKAAVSDESGLPLNLMTL